ncbi:MAG TPA: ABC transporter ATP-binding protein [Candidatus Limnocylindrales bacterium]|nr:ABC transporter ATP-binding protein [Candidatus Limnocylindrales bacterium]
MTDTVIAARGLTKRFGKVVALDGIDLNVARGTAFGLVGPPGAGKSTLIRVLAGLVRPTAGTLTIDGAKAGSVQSRRRLGVVLEDAELYGWMTGREVLAFAADLGGVQDDGMTGRIDATAGQLRLEGVLDRRVSAIDRPTCDRLAIAQALVGDPEILVLDEPALGLDPDSRREMLGFVAALRGRATVVVASRRFADVHGLCDRVALMDAGRITLEASIAEVRARMPSVYVVQTGSAGGLALAGVVARLRAEPWVTDVSIAGGTLRVAVSDDERAARELVQAVVSIGVPVIAFRQEHGSVDQLDTGPRPA